MIRHTNTPTSTAPAVAAHRKLPPSASYYLSDAQLQRELDKCEFCETRPCLEACPCHCSPADFIMAAQGGTPVDIGRAAALIMSQNPLGGVCGQVCPDHHCMSACVHRELDGAVDIPAVQAALVARAKALGVMPPLPAPHPSSRRVAVVGSGPAGLAAAAVLGRRGHEVTVFEQKPVLGGMCRNIPAFRLDPTALDSDLEWLKTLGAIQFKTSETVRSLDALLANGFDAVVLATGLWEPISLGIDDEGVAVAGVAFLEQHAGDAPSLGRVAVVGGGATAFDCAMTAKQRGAAHVELIALELLSEMPLSRLEQEALLKSGIEVTGRTRVLSVAAEDGRITSVRTTRVTLDPGATAFAPSAMHDVPGATTARADIDTLLVAIGNRPLLPAGSSEAVFVAGDCTEGPTTVVEATAAGKQAAEAVHAYLTGGPAPAPLERREGRLKSRVPIPGYNFEPVPLTTDFFGRSLRSPFLLSAAPPTDGLEQMRLGYEAGWAGGIMKTAFDGVPIHIPSRYMFTFSDDTYANCDNVSGHALERVCREIEILVREYPDRLTCGSTGGPVTGDDAADGRAWQSNTRKLEASGAMAIEYSLSCPQGGDGTEGDIVSQNARLTAKIIDWVLSAGDGGVPKLFKLTAAVTSIATIVEAVREVFAAHPGKPAGITLANTFPTLEFRGGGSKRWDEGIVVGMSGKGALHISYLTLAKVAHLGVHVSGNGGPMDYRAAANFLALGARSVQFCTVVMKHGYRIVNELHSGLSHLMAARGIGSVAEFIGIALPQPITDFMALSPQKLVSEPQAELCLHCGNCSRCPYRAISRGPAGDPVTDASRCVGCGICALKCFAGAIAMRARTVDEHAALCEA